MIQPLNMVVVLKLRVNAYLYMTSAFPWFSCFMVCKLKAIYCHHSLGFSMCRNYL
jgi:hypothetical protein